MARGIPGTFAEVKINLRERIKEMQERLKHYDRREKMLSELKKWMAHRKLETTDLWWMLKEMKPSRPKGTPVQSKKSLRPTDGKLSQASFGTGLVPAKANADRKFMAAIREARLAKEWRLEDVAEKLGLSGASIQNYEAGRSVPKPKMSARLLKVLGLPASLGQKSNGALSRVDKLKKTPRGDPEFMRAIKAARVAQNLSCKQVAKKLGISDSTLSAYERGFYIPHESIRLKVLKMYDLPVVLGKEKTAEMERRTGQHAAPKH